MTDATPPPPPPPHDPRAQAAADKAYAKASRPWYKKKRWIIPIAVVALIVIVSVSSGGGGSSSGDVTTANSGSSQDSNSDSADDSSKSEGSKGGVGSEDNPAPRGTTVKNKSASYTIDNVAVRDSLGDFADSPSGKFVVVTLTVENLKKDTIQVSSDDFKIQVAGTEIASDTDAFVLDDAFSYDDLSPGLKRSGKVVFDVAPRNAGKGILVAQAQLSLDDPVYLKLQK